MIKSTRKNKPTQSSKDKYPCLLESTTKESGTVVLMTEKGKGTIVSGNGTTFFNTVGNYTDGWVMNCFKPYEGTITLENK